MTRDTYLEITYRHGKPLAGYLHLPRQPGDKVARSHKSSAGLVVDYTEDDRAIGIEITALEAVSVESINALLTDLHQQNLGREELAPLLAG